MTWDFDRWHREKATHTDGPALLDSPSKSRD